MFASKIFLKLLLVTVLTFFVPACKKPPGPGGKATVKGKVYAVDWENTQRVVISRGYSPGEKVYIIYGDNISVNNNVRTGPDGSFEFKFLNKGHYKVFVNSLDTTIVGYKGDKTYKPVLKEFDITGVKQTVNLGDFVINK